MVFLGFSWISIDFHWFWWIYIDFYGFSWISIVFHGFKRFWGQNVWQPVPPCAAGLDPPNIKISDLGGLDLKACCLDVWMLAGLEWIGMGGYPPSLLGENCLHHKLALAKARAIYECQLFQGMGFYNSSPITNIAKAICESLFAEKKTPAARKKTSTGLLHVPRLPGTSSLPKKEAPAACKKASPGYRSQMALAIFVIGHTHIQIELWLTMPSQNHNIAR